MSIRYALPLLFGTTWSNSSDIPGQPKKAKVYAAVARVMATIAHTTGEEDHDLVLTMPAEQAWSKPIGIFD